MNKQDKSKKETAAKPFDDAVAGASPGEKDRLADMAFRLSLQAQMMRLGK